MTCSVSSGEPGTRVEAPRCRWPVDLARAGHCVSEVMIPVAGNAGSDHGWGA
jgi:hypothetical protein